MKLKGLEVQNQKGPVQTQIISQLRIGIRRILFFPGRTRPFQRGQLPFRHPELLTCKMCKQLKRDEGTGKELGRNWEGTGKELGTGRNWSHGCFADTFWLEDQTDATVEGSPESGAAAVHVTHPKDAGNCRSSRCSHRHSSNQTPAAPDLWRARHGPGVHRRQNDHPSF